MAIEDPRPMRTRRRTGKPQKYAIYAYLTKEEFELVVKASGSRRESKSCFVSWAAIDKATGVLGEKEAKRILSGKPPSRGETD